MAAWFFLALSALGNYHSPSMKRIGLSAIAALLAAAHVHAQLNGVTAELKLAENQYMPGEDLQLKIEVLNRSGQEITLGTDNKWVVLSITRDHGLPCSELGVMPVQGEFSLQSGEEGLRALNPTPYYDFAKPGRYHISAKVRLAQWQQEISAAPVTFTVVDAVPLQNLANLQIGLAPPPGVTNVAPEIRNYSLLRITDLKGVKLYFRLTDGLGKTLRIFPICRVTSFSDPEVQIDRFNNLNVLVQTGARSFGYCVMNPQGELVLRQTHIYTDTRPELRMDPNGGIFVAHGARRISEDDIPPPAPQAAKQ